MAPEKISTWLTGKTISNWMAILIVLASSVGNYYVMGGNVSLNTKKVESHEEKIRALEIKTLEMNYNLLILINEISADELAKWTLTALTVVGFFRITEQAILGNGDANTWRCGHSGHSDVF